MTPTQLRAYSAVVRLGSVKAAAAELEVTDAAISFHVGQLRKELGDQLFSRTPSGLALTPGGLRLASRAMELLGLQDRTVLEVSQAGSGRRSLRVAASSLFAEHAAPGLIELFTSRANDLDVELSIYPPEAFASLLMTRTVDFAIGPQVTPPREDLVQMPFLNYRVVMVTGPEHPGVNTRAGSARLRERTWLLGPSAAQADGVLAATVRRFGIPEGQQRIFQSQAAAVEEAKRNRGIALAVSFTVADDVRSGLLVQGSGPGSSVQDGWCAFALPDHDLVPAAAELKRFITSPRALQAMLRGSGVNLGHFRPSIHITLWS